ncbi:MAG: carbohydrate ABC transporter permease [Tyzzerella sp.]|nr:carbohydrate ABC transporter permease [Tyzzerella sp.]
MKRKHKKAIREALKIILGVIIMFPLIIMIITAFMPKAEVLSIPFNLSIKNPTLDNFAYVFKYLEILTYLKNTFVVIGVCVPVQVITSLLAAYAFSYFEFPLKKTIFTLLLMSMMIPGEVVMMTLFKMIVNWELINTYASLIITHLVSVGAVFMFRQNMLSLPRSLWEAARMDGCGYMKYFSSILVPLCKTLIVARVLESFIWTYNSHLWPLMVITTDTMKTVQVGVASLTGAQHSGIVLAATACVLVIPVLLFIFGMDKISEGLTAGAVKS